MLDIFAVEYTGEIFASVSPDTEKFSPTTFFENTILPIYAQRNTQLRAIKTDLGRDFAVCDYRELLTREQIIQLHHVTGGAEACEAFARAFNSEFCDMGMIVQRYRSLVDLKGDFIIWLQAFNRHRKIGRRLN